MMIPCGGVDKKTEESDSSNAVDDVQPPKTDSMNNESATSEDMDTEDTSDNASQPYDNNESSNDVYDESLDKHERQANVSSYTYTDISKTVYTTATLNIRTGPSTAFDRIRIYPYASDISVTGRCNETGWYRVNYNGTTAYCDADYTTNTEPNTQTEEQAQIGIQKDTATSLIYNIVSAGDNDVSSYYVGLVQSAFNSLPQWVQTSFANNGWQIKMRSGSWLYEYGWNMQLKGLTYYDYKTIYISARDDAANYNTVAHEMGHYVDWIYGQPSHLHEFGVIYNSEYKSFCNYYNYSNGYPSAEELFAEGIYHYWTDPGTLASVVPQTYAYIQRILS